MIFARRRGEPAKVRDRWSGPGLWWRIFLGLLCLSTLWSLATPLGGGPDEPNHLIRANALIHGQLEGTPESGPLLGPDTASGSPVTQWTKVQVNEAYASTVPVPLCYVGLPKVPAGCSPPVSSSSKSVPVVIYVGRYPPLYYALVGWPTAFVSNATAAFYVVRLMNGFLCCGLIALALCLALRAASPKFLFVGVLTAMTPMVFYLSAIINPNSLEVAAGLCLWTASILLAGQLGGEMSTSLLRIVIADAVILVLVRPDTPLWVVVIAVALSPIVIRSPLVQWRAVLARREVRGGVAVVAGTAVLAAAWTVTQHATKVGALAPPPVGEPFSGLLRGTLGQASGWVTQTVGDFAWGGDLAPLLSVLAWVIVTGSMILFAVSFGRRRHRLALGLTVLVTIMVPVSLVLVIVRHNGFIGVDRYFMALFVGIPIVASVVMEPTVAIFDNARQLVKTFVVLLGVGQFAAFFWALHRVLVGVGGSFSPTAKPAGAWTPPIPALVLDAAYAGAVMFAGVLVLRLYNQYRPEGSHADGAVLPAGESVPA